jgi:hypothetical protein
MCHFLQSVRYTHIPTYCLWGFHVVVQLLSPRLIWSVMEPSNSVYSDTDSWLNLQVALTYPAHSWVWKMKIVKPCVLFQDCQTITTELPSKCASSGKCTGRPQHPAPSTRLQCNPCGDEQDNPQPQWTVAWAIFCPSSMRVYNDCSWRSTYP